MSNDVEAAAEQSRSVLRSSGARAAGLLLPLTSLVLFLWPRGGYTKTGLIEEWGLYLKMLSGTPIVPLGGQLRLRPLSKIPQALAYAISPDSFVALNVIHAILFVAKGASAYALVVALAPGRRVLALLTGAFFMVWPADTGLFATRAIAPQFGIVVFLLAATCFVRFVKSGRVLAAAAMFATQALALLVHEIVLPLAVVTPLVMIHRAMPRVWWARIATWYVLPVAAAARIAWTILGGERSSYQRGKLDIPTPTELVEAVGEMYLRLFGKVWFGADLVAQWETIAIGIVAAVPLAVVSARLLSRPAPPPAEWQASSVRLAVAGVVVAAAGFGAYLPTLMRNVGYTTLYASSLGAALCTALLCELVTSRMRRGSVVLALLTVCVVAVLATSARSRHEQFVQWSRAQQRILLDIVRQSGGGFRAGTFVVLIGDSPASTPSWQFNPKYPFYPPVAFTDSVRFTLGDEQVKPRLCYPRHALNESKKWWSHACTLDADGMRVMLANRTISIPYEKLVAFHYDRRTGSARLLRQLPGSYLAGAARGYAPEKLLRANPAAVARAERILSDPRPLRAVPPASRPRRQVATQDPVQVR